MARVAGQSGAEIITYRPRGPERGEIPPPAVEPPPPEEVASADELYLIGLHLEQYRHATRCPTLYWREALRRDGLDARANNALGLWHLRRGEFAPAEACFRRAIQRLTGHNANPYDGEPLYNLGLCLRYQIDAAGASDPAADDLFRQAYAAFYKATWSQAWSSAGYHALAEMDCRQGRFATALEHLDRCLRRDSDNLRARDLRTAVLRKLDRQAEAEQSLHDTLAMDPLDWWAHWLAGQPMTCDVQVLLDLAHDHVRAGLYPEAVELLHCAEAAVQSNGGQSGQMSLPTQSWGTAPLVDYTLGWLHQRLGNASQAEAMRRRAAARSPDYCFPARLEEIAVLEAAVRAGPDDARAPGYLGNLLYDRRRHEEAMAMWQRSARLDPHNTVVWRNLGIGYFNLRRQPAKARAAYEKAFRADPRARILYERDQLWKRLGDPPAKRLRKLQKHAGLVDLRDDLTVELCRTVQPDRPTPAGARAAKRKKIPALGGRRRAGVGAVCPQPPGPGPHGAGPGRCRGRTGAFSGGGRAPQNLGEARHLLSNQSDVQYWLGCAARRWEKSPRRASIGWRPPTPRGTSRR